MSAEKWEYRFEGNFDFDYALKLYRKKTDSHCWELYRECVTQCAKLCGDIFYNYGITTFCINEETGEESEVLSYLSRFVAAEDILVVCNGHTLSFFDPKSKVFTEFDRLAFNVSNLKYVAGWLYVETFTSYDRPWDNFIQYGSFKTRHVSRIHRIKLNGLTAGPTEHLFETEHVIGTINIDEKSNTCNFRINRGNRKNPKWEEINIVMSGKHQNGYHLV